MEFRALSCQKGAWLTWDQAIYQGSASLSQMIIHDHRYVFSPSSQWSARLVYLSVQWMWWLLKTNLSSSFLYVFSPSHVWIKHYRFHFRRHCGWICIYFAFLWSSLCYCKLCLQDFVCPLGICLSIKLLDWFFSHCRIDISFCCSCSTFLYQGTIM